MAVIYLKHPVHGYKVESNEAVAQQDRENGWVDYDPAELKRAPEPAAKPAPAAQVIPDFLKAPAAPAIKKKAKPEG